MSDLKPLIRPNCGGKVNAARMKCEYCGTEFRCDNDGVLKIRYESPEDAERIIMQWASEHPIMTNRRKFAETFGFDVATMFEVNRGNAGWLDEEYKGGDGNV